MSPTAQPASLQEFSLSSRLGDGSYSEVYKAHHDTTGAVYALKVINKKHILRHKVVHQVQRERLLLSQLNNDGIIKLFFTFQDAHSLYLALEYCSNGELYDQIRLQGRLDVSTTQFYAAEMVLMLEYLRNHGIVHRDLKPENLLLTDDGHLKLIDFGSAKSLIDDSRTEDSNQGDPLVDEARNRQETELEIEETSEQDTQKRASSFVGTADYVCPEMLNSQAVGYAADLWALGCVVYQMLIGKPPFKAVTEYLTFQKISTGEYQHLESGGSGSGGGDCGSVTTSKEDLKVSEEARDLVEKLLILDSAQRLGADSLEDLKNHAFFKGIEWETLRQSKAPEVKSPQEGGSGSGGRDSDGEGYDWELQSMKARKNGF